MVGSLRYWMTSSARASTEGGIAIAPELVTWIQHLRRQRWTGAQIARALHLSRATVARYLQRLGLARLRALEPVPPVQRYEYARPGGLVHLDIKKLGRIGRIGHRITGDRRARARDRKERGHEAWALRLLGEIHAHRGPPDVEVAEEYYHESLALAEELGMRPLAAHCHFGLAKLYR
jgi:AraC-like DNA-binding protein